jgi:hypothetical protein
MQLQKIFIVILQKKEHGTTQYPRSNWGEQSL